jgi:hypothetical protein
MSSLKIFIEYHFGRRKPNLKYYFNNEIIDPQNEMIAEEHKNQQNSILSFDVDLLKYNTLKIYMQDKTDNDLVFLNDKQFIDHWCKIREIEVDGIKFETALLNCCNFRHTMSKQWLEDMHSKGHEILPFYDRCNEMRLNGEFTINFFSPVWQFQIENYHERTY